MLVVGLVFLAVIGLGELVHHAGQKRKRAKLDRPLEEPSAMGPP